ncbi:hypothetical protein [Zavarzinia sp.]|uniref:hypothetical protein n=1 Tax=Zavarzinia sp. TaxID=2027920 RepID=UPI0035694547
MSDRDTEKTIPAVQYQLVATGGSAQIIAFPQPSPEAKLVAAEKALSSAAASVYAAGDED